jgi:hypothetical protein
MKLREPQLNCMCTACGAMNTSDIKIKQVVRLNLLCYCIQSVFKFEMQGFLNGSLRHCKDNPPTHEVICKKSVTLTLSRNRPWRPMGL